MRRAQRPQQGAQRLLGAERAEAAGVTAQVEEQLSIGKLIREPCAATSASEVLPTPAIPLITQIPACLPGRAAASASHANSASRAVKEAIARGSVRVGGPPSAATLLPVSVRPRAASSKLALMGPSRPSAAASRRVVSARGLLTIPRSRSLIAVNDTPDAWPSSSTVRPASLRSSLSRSPKERLPLPPSRNSRRRRMTVMNPSSCTTVGAGLRSASHDRRVAGTPLPSPSHKVM